MARRVGPGRESEDPAGSRQSRRGSRRPESHSKVEEDILKVRLKGSGPDLGGDGEIDRALEDEW